MDRIHEGLEEKNLARTRIDCLLDKNLFDLISRESDYSVSNTECNPDKSNSLGWICVKSIRSVKERYRAVFSKIRDFLSLLLSCWSYDA